MLYFLEYIEYIYGTFSNCFCQAYFNLLNFIK